MTNDQAIAIAVAVDGFITKKIQAEIAVTYGDIGKMILEMVEPIERASYRAGAEAGWKAYETALAAMRANGASPELKPLMILPEPPDDSDAAPLPNTNDKISEHVFPR